MPRAAQAAQILKLYRKSVQLPSRIREIVRFAGSGHECPLDVGCSNDAATEASSDVAHHPVEWGDQAPRFDKSRGHLVALREGDLAYLHVHPTAHGEESAEREQATQPVAFSTHFPSDGRYRLFLQFKHEGRVHTAAFTMEIAR